MHIDTQKSIVPSKATKE